MFLIVLVQTFQIQASKMNFFLLEWVIAAQKKQKIERKVIDSKDSFA